MCTADAGHGKNRHEDGQRPTRSDDNPAAVLTLAAVQKDGRNNAIS